MLVRPALGPCLPVIGSIGLQISKDPNLQKDRNTVARVDPGFEVRRGETVPTGLKSRGVGGVGWIYIYIFHIIIIVYISNIRLSL